MPNDASDSPFISPDGRFIAYRSFASNNVATDLNEVPDLMLYDRSNSLTMLVTASDAGNRTANNRSAPVAFSADGKTLVFSSWASDLLPQDFNRGSDVSIIVSGGLVRFRQFHLAAMAALRFPGCKCSNPPAPARSGLLWPAEAEIYYRINSKEAI